jgi:hypothetical protein
VRRARLFLAAAVLGLSLVLMLPLGTVSRLLLPVLLWAVEEAERIVT